MNNSIEESRPLAEEEVECRKCHAHWVPNFMRDYYGQQGDDRRSGTCEGCMMQEHMPKPPVPVPTKEHLQTVCRFGQGGAQVCRYLAFGAELSCAKKSVLQRTIDDKAETMTAKGDNCSGPPDFTPTPQES